MGKTRSGMDPKLTITTRLTRINKEILEQLKIDWGYDTIDQVIEALVMDSEKAKSSLLGPKLSENPLVKKISK
jgi:hypothetical protein